MRLWTKVATVMGATAKFATVMGLSASFALAQESSSGFSLPMVMSGQLLHSERGLTGSSASPALASFRTTLCPSLKLGSHWFAYGAVQVHSAPHFYNELPDRVRSLEVNAVQAYFGYSATSTNKSLIVKAGQLSSAFGSFPLRYDDTRNWLIDVPQGYGYYYDPVTLYGLPAAEVDVTIGKVDARVQFTNSSPANPRRLWQSDQYGSWTAGGGFAPKQGFRIGGSAYWGPYLHRSHQFFFPGEAPPKSLPASAIGLDAQFTSGRWNVNGELQRFRFPYRAIPNFYATSGYGEAKFTINPRWYVAGRAGRRNRTAGIGTDDSLEAVAAFRLGQGHLIKAGYEAVRSQQSPGNGARDNVVAIQLVFSVNSLNWAFR